MKETRGKNVAGKGKIIDSSAGSPQMDRDKPGTSNSKLIPSKIQSRYPLLAKAFEIKMANQKFEVVNAGNDSNDSVMVEELTVKNYKGSSSMAVQHSSKGDQMTVRSDKEQWHHYVDITAGSSNAVIRASELNGANKRPPIPVRPPPPVRRFFPPKSVSETRQTPRVLSSEGGILGNSSSRSYEEMRTQPQPSSGVLPHSSKSSLKDKGTVNASHRSDHTKAKTASFDQTSQRRDGRVNFGSVVHDFRARKKRLSEDGCATDPSPSPLGVIAGLTEADSHGECLREWIEEGSCKNKKDERLFVFRQVLELVAEAQSVGAALKELRPSRFLVFPSKKVKYVGMWSGPGNEKDVVVTNQISFSGEYCGERKRLFEHGYKSCEGIFPKHQKLERSKMKKVWDPNFDGSNHFEVGAEIDLNCAYQDPTFDGHIHSFSLNQTQSKCESAQLEEKWYSSPEEIKGECCTVQSNIFSLGVLLFELCCSFDSPELHVRAMCDLPHRILPPKFLSENTKEAGFILWLMHPIPSSRPKPSEIMESDLIKEISYLPLTSEVSSAIEEEESQSEVLMHFLLTLKDQKQKQASKLVKDLGYLKDDIEEARKRESSNIEQLDKNNAISDASSSSMAPPHPLMKNISQLEHAYFSMKLQNANDLGKNTKKDALDDKDTLGAFFEGVCKYARYSKFVTCGMVRSADFMGSGNIICSLSFDRDEEYLAAAGISKKIKIFEYESLLNDMVDIHYPRLEISNKSRLSSVCWNSYIKNYLASADYDGVVKLWDCTTGQTLNQYKGHLQRAWSVDFCRVDPTKLASGSDDGQVKLWCINRDKCVCTISTDPISNVCCVQFSTRSTNMLAFGSVDSKIKCYDLRHTRAPWCTLVGHGKAVSYVKFLDKDTLVSASIDNTIKLWDLNNLTSGDVCKSPGLTFTGHSNEKNFVGLSVFDGYIACGSESNEVVAYYRSLPMPITSYKFGSVDPISGKEENEHGPFVSSVCWRGNSNMVVAANSNGVIKLFQLK